MRARRFPEDAGQQKKAVHMGRCGEAVVTSATASSLAVLRQALSLRMSAPGPDGKGALEHAK